MKYAVLVFPLSKKDGGGYAGIVPDLPGCMSDGETPEEAIRNTEQAIKDWIAVARQAKRKVPKPGAAVEKAKRAAAKVEEALKNVKNMDHRLNALAAQVAQLREAQQESPFGGFPIFATVASRAKVSRETADC